jgi:hypothetical protein
MLSRRPFGFALIAVAVFASGAMGTTITQNLPYSDTPDYTKVLTFNQFDDLGGTLTLQSVYVSVSLNASGGALRCDNDAATPASGGITFGAQAAVASSVPMIDAFFQPIFQAGDVTATGGTTLNLSADDGDVEVSGTPQFSMQGTDYGFYIGGLASGGDAGFVNSLAFPQYTGLGTFTVTLNASQVANYGSLGGVQAQIDPLIAGGVVTVIYNYTPEPATLGLLALTGLVVIRRRR